MSNSALICDVVRSKWCAARDHAIDRITIHHAAAINVTGRQIAESFTGERYASANYCIGTAGDICLSVDEDYRAFTSNSSANDARAVTIEVANCAGWPDWPVSDASYEALLKLCEDVCRRNGKTRMVWLADSAARVAYEPKDGEMGMTLHRDFAATACPGAYLTARMQEIAEEVTRRLAGASPSPAAAAAPSPAGGGKGREDAATRYDTVDALPEWARETVARLCGAGVLKGGGTATDEAGYPADLDLSHDMVRLLVILDRAGCFGGDPSVLQSAAAPLAGEQRAAGSGCGLPCETERAAGDAGPCDGDVGTNDEERRAGSCCGLPSETERAAGDAGPCGFG